MSLTDAQLIARVLERDDRHAFSALVRRHQSSVRTLLRRLCCGDDSLADDLGQETFMRAYRGLPQLRGSAGFGSWLYRIAYNTFLSARSRRRELPEPVDEPSAVPAPIGMRRDLDAALVRLSDAERAAVTLSLTLGATHEEIAASLECPLGTAKSHVTRGKEKLRRALRAYQPEVA